MFITLVGFSHKTAPFDVLEQVAGNADVVPQLFDPVLGLTESVSLVTCNRAEFYFAAEQDSPVAASLIRGLARGSSLDDEALLGHAFVLSSVDAARHAMRVAAGLDSLVLGEPQILGQMGRALESAQRAGAAGPVLSRLFEAASQAGRRARHETEISQHTASVSHAAARLARTHLGDLRAVSVLVLGAGEAAELALQALAQSGARQLICSSRTWAHAHALAERSGATAVPWDRLDDSLADADVVVAATSAPEPIVRKDQLARLSAARAGRSLVAIDLGIPRNIEPEVDELEGVCRFGIEDLRAVVNDGLARREAAIPAVEAIVEEELERFRQWLAARRVVPIITGLRQRVLQTVHAEAHAGLVRVHRGEESVEQVAALLADRITTKVLHGPVVRLKERAAQDGADVHADVLRDLFELDTDPSPR
jgi:glutamyl-tRNA reductase